MTRSGRYEAVYLDGMVVARERERVQRDEGAGWDPFCETAEGLLVHSSEGGRTGRARR